MNNLLTMIGQQNAHTQQQVRDSAQEAARQATGMEARFTAVINQLASHLSNLSGGASSSNPPPARTPSLGGVIKSIPKPLTYPETLAENSTCTVLEYINHVLRPYLAEIMKAMGNAPVSNSFLVALIITMFQNDVRMAWNDHLVKHPELRDDLDGLYAWLISFYPPEDVHLRNHRAYDALMKALHNGTMSLQVFLTKVISLHARLEAAGTPKCLTDQLLNLIRALPNEYRNLPGCQYTSQQWTSVHQLAEAVLNRAREANLPVDEPPRKTQREQRGSSEQRGSGDGQRGKGGNQQGGNQQGGNQQKRGGSPFFKKRPFNEVIKGDASGSGGDDRKKGGNNGASGSGSGNGASGSRSADRPRFPPCRFCGKTNHPADRCYSNPDVKGKGKKK